MRLTSPPPIGTVRLDVASAMGKRHPSPPFSGLFAFLTGGDVFWWDKFRIYRVIRRNHKEQMASLKLLEEEIFLIKTLLQIHAVKTDTALTIAERNRDRLDLERWSKETHDQAR